MNIFAMQSLLETVMRAYVERGIGGNSPVKVKAGANLGKEWQGDNSSEAKAKKEKE